jgi:hypothetical protein
MKLNLSADNLTTIGWWVDASHAVQDNCHGHTGAMMLMGKRQQLASSISTKSTPNAPPNLSLLAPTKPSPLSYTQDILLRHKATPLNKTSFSRTTSPACD